MYNERDSFIIFSLKIFLFEKYILNHMGPFVHRDFFLLTSSVPVVWLLNHHITYSWEIPSWTAIRRSKSKLVFLSPSKSDIPWKLCSWQQVAILTVCVIKTALLFVAWSKLTAIIKQCSLTQNGAQLWQNPLQVTAEKYTTSHIYQLANASGRKHIASLNCL